MKHLLLFALLTADVALGNSYSVEIIDLPRPDSVVAFTNGFPVSTGERLMKKKEDIVKFLKDGVYLRKVPSAEDEVLLIQNPGETTDGYFTDKNGRFYSWTLLSPTLLWLKTPEGGGAILGIKK
jgi:hypothetical protein